MISSLLYFLFCFALVFAPKFGVVDFAILLPAMLLPFIFFNKRWKISRHFFSLAMMVVALIVYQLCVQMVNQNFQFAAVGRLMRALVTTIIVGFLFGTANNDDLGRKVFRALLAALAFHAFLIVVAAFVYPFNEFLSLISGNDRVRMYRASGLMAGFDIAGFLNIIGIAMIIFRVYAIKSTVVNLLLLILFFLSCYFTSRVSMVISGLLLLVYAVTLLRSSEISLFNRIVMFLILIFFTYEIAYKVMEIFEVTMALGLIDVDPMIATGVVTRHAVLDPRDFLWKSMFFVPDSMWQFIFGTGGDVLDSDVGYVKEIFRYGVVGLVFAVISHIIFTFKIFDSRFRLNLHSRSGRLVVFVFFAMFLLTLKNNYIFVRGVFPVYLILVAIAVYGFNEKPGRRLK